MKYIDADLLRKEIDRRYEENREKARYDDYYRGMNDGLDHFEQFLDSLQQEQKPILEVFGFKVGDAVRLKDGDGRKHIIKSFEEVGGLHGPNFYHVEFEDNSARDGIYPGEEYPNGYYTQMEKLEEEQKEQPMPDSTKLIELWHEDKEKLKEKDFRNDPWRLAYNAFLCGFGRGIAVNKQEQHSEDLEEAAEKFARFYDNGTCDGIAQDCFKAGAEWQSKRDQETIETAEDHAFLAGSNWQKEQMKKGNPIVMSVEDFQVLIDNTIKRAEKEAREQMMKGAVEGEVCGRVKDHINVRFPDGLCKYLKPENISHIPADVKKYKVGDKVRVIIVKEEEK